MECNFIGKGFTPRTCLLKESPKNSFNYPFCDRDACIFMRDEVPSDLVKKAVKALEEKFDHIPCRSADEATGMEKYRAMGKYVNKLCQKWGERFEKADTFSTKMKPDVQKSWTNVKKYIKGESKKPPFKDVTVLCQNLEKRFAMPFTEIKKSKTIKWRRYTHL